MHFVRQAADNWRRDVPGTRWFKADLHLHTIDDLQGGNAKLPSGINGAPDSPETISAYARRFLQGAMARDVRVLGLTPHSPRIGASGTASAVWGIVEEWNSGLDDDGIPFRERIYAVFPGFEPSLKQGSEGLHLLFLFDPEIGRDDYLKAFDLVMGGVSPWHEKNGLRISSLTAQDAFGALRDFHDRECPRDAGDRPLWRYIVLAPHIELKKGLLGAQRAQVLRLFDHGEVAGLELGDHKLPEDTVRKRPWLPGAMAANHQAFFHGSDAYSVDEIGKRHTWLKLANPRVEALRQAFLARDSRIRIGYERDGDGGLTEVPKPPDVTMNDRPWLKSVTVSGRASFFGGSVEGKPNSRFDLSPDLTCIIGGSMTGKSTFLDGLRVHVRAALPKDDNLASQVEARGGERFLAGSAEVTLDCPGQDPTAPPHQRWPAVFHAQNELQRLAQEPDAIEGILARLVASETHDIQAREERLDGLNEELTLTAGRLAELDDKAAEAEQACERSRKAKEELDAFSDAGVENLHRASGDSGRWRESMELAGEWAKELDRLPDSAGAFELPEIDGHLANVFRDAGMGDRANELQDRWDRIRSLLRSAKDELGAANAVHRTITDALTAHEQKVRKEVDRALADRGMDGARIKEFQALSGQAAMLDSYTAHLNEVRSEITAAKRSFETLLTDRRDLVARQRNAFDRVTEKVRSQFDGRIEARRIEAGRREPLDGFLRGLSQKGITRWWNDLPDPQRPTPDELLRRLDEDQLADVGMSEAVQATFRNCLTPSKRRALAALHCSDLYRLELGMDDGSHRPLEDLSGGQRVSLLLSLLLETNDERPLVIDQPEDELDNRFLFETLLPALKRLKGRRQIIVATHNANIVVNGDADQVIQLEATANRGYIAHAGAIEEPSVRDAIVRTVDGGDEAFRLRRLKYGF